MKKLISYITDKQLTAEIVSIFSNAVNMHIKGWQSEIVHINDFIKNGIPANAQAIARFTTDLEQKFITSLGQYTDALINVVKVQTASGMAAAQNVFAPAVRTTGGRRAAINPGPNRGG